MDKDCGCRLAHAPHESGDATAFRIEQCPRHSEANVLKLETEIAAFRSATPSLCNCSECRELRKEFDDE